MATTNKTQFLHIKLNKLVYGKNQHIFKTTMNSSIEENSINISQTQNETPNNSFNTILYSNFIPGTNNSTYQLFDYDELNFLYNKNETDSSKLAPYLNNISDFYKKYFYKYATPEKDTQNIYYFKQITTPIDIININNTGFFLSPLQTIKNIELIQQNVFLDNKDANVKATNKPAYKDMWKYTADRTMNFSENNSMPIYDLTFNFLDTINLSTYENLTDWIESYEFNDISSQIIYIDERDNSYSINIHYLLDELTNNPTYNYKYDNNTTINILTDLLSHISNNQSINKYIDKYSVISKLNTAYTSKILNSSILSSLFNKKSSEDIKYIFNKTYVDNFLVNEIPQNTLYTTNLNQNINIPNNFYNKISATLGFVNLKNQQTPEYEYDLELPERMYDIITYYNWEQIITINQANNIYYSGTSKIAAELERGTYLIEYVSSVFSIHVPNAIIYNNNFLHSFFPASNLSQISSQIESYLSNYPDDVKNEISSHIYQAAFNATVIPTEPDKTLNTDLKKDYISKARSIDFNIPPEYAFNKNKFIKPALSAAKWYMSKDEASQIYIPYYFPSGRVHITNYNYKDLLSTDFIQQTEEPTQNPPYGQIVSTYVVINDYKENIYFYFNSSLPIYGDCTFKIKRWYKNYENIETDIDNYNRMMLYDGDQNKSYEFNIDNSYNQTILDGKTYTNPTKIVVSSLLQKAAIEDEKLAKQDEEYAENYQIRMKDKIDNYYKTQFTELHIENNRCAQIGNLNGLRIYENIGKTNDNILWSSYKYVTTKSNNILNALSINYTSPFKSYTINRFSQNMELNEIGNIKYKGTKNIKSMVINQYNSPYGFYDTAKKCFLCSARFYCGLPKDKICNEGYCTFPYNNIDKYYTANNSILPNDVYNNQIKSNNITSSIYYIENNSSINEQIKTKTDINVNDDLEIYFINANISNSDIINLFNDEEFRYYSYKSIFQGFGGKTNINNTVLYPDYLMINNKNNTTEDVFQTLSIDMYLSSLYLYVQPSKEQSDDPVSTIFGNTKLLSYIYKFIKLDEDKKEYYIDNNNVSSTTLLSTETSAINTEVNTLLADSNYAFILSSSIKLYDRYAKDQRIYDHKQYTYREVSMTSLYDMICTSKKFGKIFKEFKQKISLENSYILNNGFVISKYSPFNGPHKIKGDTILKGLHLNGSSLSEIKENLSFHMYDLNDIIDYIPKNHNIIMRVVNWWDDFPKCTGTFVISPIDEELTDNPLINEINNLTNKFDFIEALDETSLIKLNQGNYRKSNIYSIKIKNSGLNPDNQILTNIKQYTCLKDYINLSDQQKQLFYLIDINTINEDIKNNQKSVMLAHYNALMYIATDTDIPFLKANLPGNPNNNEQVFTQPLLDYYTKTNGYYVLNEEKLNAIKQLKIDMQHNLENAIKNSVTRYMPAETKLWKIIYEGK